MVDMEEPPTRRISPRGSRAAPHCALPPAGKPQLKASRTTTTIATTCSDATAASTFVPCSFTATLVSEGLEELEAGMPRTAEEPRSRTWREAWSGTAREDGGGSPLHVSARRSRSVRHAASFSSTPTLTALQFVRSKLAEVSNDLQAVTGEAGDVVRDEELAHGRSALTFKDASFRRRDDKDSFILAPISGHFEPGNLVALMGPSGSGKTLLLDILAGKKAPPYGGTIHVNGRPRDRLFVRMTAYVPQQDAMPAHMTVEEAIGFVQSLRQELPTKAKVCREMRREMMDVLLNGLGLTQVRHARIGDESTRGISGGERKRVSLARGLASGAQIIFIDEATSGLSATDAEKCARYMRLTAHKFGVTILAAIHQPRLEVARLFDHLLLLTAGPGRAVYNGPMAEASKFWSLAGLPVPPKVNPTDFFLDLVTPGTSRSRVSQIVAHYDAHLGPVIDQLVQRELHRERETNLQLLGIRHHQLQRFGRMPGVRHSKYSAGFFKQLRVVGWRQLMLHLRDKQGLTTDLAIPIAKAVVIGIAYWGIGGKTQGTGAVMDGIHAAMQQTYFLFMVLMACALDGMKVMPKLIGERMVMKSETDDALYSQWAYVISFSILSSVQAVMSQALFFVLLTLLTKLPWSLVPEIFFWTLMLYFAFDSVYMLVAAVAKDATTAQILALPFVILFLLVNGLTVTSKTAPAYLKWAVSVSPTAQAMQAMAIAASDCYGGQWSFVINMFGYKRDFAGCLCVFLVCIVVLRILQLILLRLFHNRKT